MEIGVCNAWRHPAGCECGFGPPYPARLSYGTGREWAEEAAEDRQVMRRGLNEMEWDVTSIEEFVQAYEQFNSTDPDMPALVLKVKELLGMYRVVEEEVWYERIKVPLYRFGAPDVSGASVTYSEGDAVRHKVGWKLKVFGIGTGGSREVYVSKSRSFSASGGTCKEVFVPVRMRVARVTTFDGERVVGRGVRAEVAAKKKEEALRGRGCDTLEPSLCRDGPPGRFDEPFDVRLSGDTSGQVHEFDRSWETDVAHEVSVQLQQIADVGSLVEVERIRKLGVSFFLPSGFDYFAHFCHGGLWWERP